MHDQSPRLQTKPTGDGQESSLARTPQATTHHSLPGPGERVTSPWIDALPTLLIAFLSAYFVHRLTKTREWDKGVAERTKRIEEQVDAACEAACDAWTLRSGPKRAQAVATTKWRLQQIGQSAAALRKFALHRRWAFGAFYLPTFSARTIDLIVSVSHLREALTVDPFEDPKRNADNKRLTDVALAKGRFLTDLDTVWNEWAMPTRSS